MIGLTQEQDKWLARLRSGHYPQGRAALRTDKGMCCLGVIADVQNPLGWSQTAGHWYWRPWATPRPAFHDVSLSYHNKLLSADEESKFIVFNDDLNLSFRQIADEADYLFNHGGFAS